MNKKLIAVLMIITILSAMMFGCGEDNNVDNSEPSTNPTNGNTTAVQDETKQTETDATIPGGEVLTLPEFEAMSDDLKEKLMDTFDSEEDFFNWYAEIKHDYEQYVETTVPSTTEDPRLPTAPPDVTAPDKDEITFMDYHEMSGDEQLAFINSFDSPGDFAAWHAAARDAYNETMIEIDDTNPIDASDLIGKN